MGLDWMLNKYKAKEGYESEYEEITRQIDECDDDKGKEDMLMQKRDEIAVSAYEIIGCPKIGVDSEATTWWKSEIYWPSVERAKQLKSTVAKQGPLSKHHQDFVDHWLNKSMTQLLQNATGRYVPALAKIQDGHSSYQGMVAGPLDFRGKIIGMMDWLSDKLRNEAYEDHDAEECLDYAQALEDSLHLAKDAHDKDAVKAAIKWLRFWGEKGFGYYAWH